ncbi:MAG: altronate dehydratase family protein [Oscillospiraceae bacterium]|nr:altronate dehydratase family protein [Oscillospiraceae bacterium]
MNALKIHPDDNVAVALEALGEGDDALNIILMDAIPPGHKFAIRLIERGETIVKYGYPIGIASSSISPGAWVHTHNTESALESLDDIKYAARAVDAPAEGYAAFMGYPRADGRAGTRNELWILPTVACVNGAAQKLAERGRVAFGSSVDGVYAFTHPYGCSQLGADHLNTQRLLAAMARHPNAGGVLILGLGCENNHIEAFKNVLGEYDPKRVKFLNAQSVEDEFAEGFGLLSELAAEAGASRREEVSADKLIVGLKCGGSDGFSGLSANPLLGRFSDILTARGGSTLLTEVPEMFGAERMLLDRCADERTFEKARGMIRDFQTYFQRHGQPIDKNPSPGNLEGGLTTNADKSLGCTQKAGRGVVRDVLALYEPARVNGLSLVNGPGNDPCAVTALTAAGAQIILFTTGRGTPLGSPVPVIKVSSNSEIARRKPHWIDFDAGAIFRGYGAQPSSIRGGGAEPLAEGEPIAALAERLFAFVLETASGRATLSEKGGYREIAIFKDGVTL